MQQKFSGYNHGRDDMVVSKTKRPMKYTELNLKDDNLKATHLDRL